MTRDQVVSSLDKITQLSNSMLTSARASDWEQLEQLEQQKRDLVEQVFPLKGTLGDTTPIIQQIQKIADLDKETMRLAAKGRKELSDLLSKMSTGRQAVAAYQDIEEK